MEDPDGRTLDAAGRGDADALTAVLELVQPHVWRFIGSLERSRETVEDLAQETLLRIVRGLPGFRGDSRFLTWSLTIARNVVRDHQRAVARRPRLVGPSHRPADHDRHDAAVVDPDTSLIVDLERAIRSLPETLREVFVLVEISGLPYRDVADVLAIAEGTVKSRMFHARRELIRLLDPGERGRHG